MDGEPFGLETVDEQSGTLHMFTLCLANFALPTSPQSSLGTQSSCSRIPCLSTVPPLILPSPQLLHTFHRHNCIGFTWMVPATSLRQSTQRCQLPHYFHLEKCPSSWPPSGVLKPPYHLWFDPNPLHESPAPLQGVLCRP